jgi:hypothetical protein
MLTIKDIKMILADVCRQKCEVVEHNGSITRLIELVSLELLLHKQLVTMYETEINQSLNLKKVG